MIIDMQAYNPSLMPVGLDDATKALLHLVQSFSEKGMNTVPFKGSWTAAQVTDHITKSNRYMHQALGLEGKLIERDPQERKEELAGVFLDFNTKLRSPDFILPSQDQYVQSALVRSLETSIDHLRSTAAVTRLQEAIEHPAFGEITKSELLYFVLYHTQRHIRQLQHIFEIVENRQYKLLSFLFMQPLPFIW